MRRLLLNILSLAALLVIVTILQQPIVLQATSNCCRDLVNCLAYGKDTTQTCCDGEQAGTGVPADCEDMGIFGVCFVHGCTMGHECWEEWSGCSDDDDCCWGTCQDWVCHEYPYDDGGGGDDCDGWAGCDCDPHDGGWECWNSSFCDEWGYCEDEEN